jgi:S-adenosylmethionine-diacylglycerol 3-amino-3-carboxypropyl transferase
MTANPQKQSDALPTEQNYEKPNPDLLKNAVHDHNALTPRGILERLFTLSFRGFVYPQIWEDPEVDIEALKIDKKTRIMTIASGGCNVMNYLTETPERVMAIDLNPAHVALARLKIAAIKHLPDYESFFLFFGHADDKRNIENYDRYIAPHLDTFTKKYWDGWSPFRGRRINYFTKNLYQFGLLGRFISAVHVLAKIYGQDPREIVNAKTREEQAEIFDRTLGPVFDKKFVKWLCNMPPALYGLGIPPAQFDELSIAAHGDMAGLLKSRLRRLAVDFPIEENYFAWQAFGRGYDRAYKKAIPRYLSEANYKRLKDNADKVEVHHTTITGFVQSQPVNSLDCYVFLDAQDWMNAAQLNILWKEVVRTARPGARVIFRTAGDESPLTKALSSHILSRFDYDPAASAEAVKKDRSSIYGGFHVYTLKDVKEEPPKLSAV